MELIKEVFHHRNFSNVTDVFLSVIKFPLKHITRVSFTFLASKLTVTVLKLCSHFEWHTRHVN